jgi:CHAT domain-containing protein/tetratricopeptide (TPR) repeat protein
MKTTQFLLSIGLCLAIGLPLTITNSIAILPAIAQANNSNRQAAEKLNQEGLNLAEQGNFPAALVKYQQALAAYKAIGDRLNEGTVLGNICLVNYYQGQPDLALDVCQQSLKIAQEISDREGISINFNTIALIYQGTGKYPQAIDYFQQALAIVRELKDRSREATILYNLGFVYNSQAKYPQALELYEQALKLSQVVGDRSQQGLVLSAMGLVYQIQGDYARSLGLFQQAQKIAIETKDRAGLGAALGNIGQTYVYLADYPQAIKYFGQSIEIFRSLNYLSQVGVNLNNQGNAYSRSGQYSKALLSLNDALKIYQSTNNRAEEATTRANIAIVYQSLGQYDLALKFYESSLSIAKSLGNKNTEGIVLGNIGTIHNITGQFSQAQTYHQQALLIHQATGNREQEGTTINNLAEDYYQLKQYSLALSTHLQALKIAEEIGDRAGAAAILNNIGKDYAAIDEIEKSLTYYRNAAQLARTIKYREIEGIALSNQGKALYRLDRLAAAEVPLRAAIDLWESMGVGLVDKDKISLQDRIKFTYDLLQKVLVEQTKTQAALEVAERGRARVLAELLASKITTINSAARQKIKQAPNLLKIQQIARAQKATLVEYSTIDERILIWVIKPTGQITFHQTRLPPKTTLKDLIVATRDGIGANRGARTKDDTPNPTGGDLKQLHQLLIAPIVKDLPTKPEERVIILPQNELFLVPFAALQDAQDKYLIQQHTITIAPSIQVLALTETKSNRLSKTPPLVVGNPIMPSFGGTQLANLPGSEAEAKGIGTILKVTPLIGAQADKQQVIALMKTAPIVHLATHGLLDTIKGDIPGAIALTNGFLTSGEIFDMQLSANLVVLSACDTGRGDLTGEGVVGLSRSLSVAGVPSVIVSLWEVNDEATKALMEEFYRNLQLKKLPKAQALRQAMLTTMVDYPNPNFWSAFMLVGEGR